MGSVKTLRTAGEYDSISRETEKHSEKKDCTVKAVALLCGVSYDEAHAKLKELGRIDGRGTSNKNTVKAVESFGFEVIKFSGDSIRSNYPKAHRQTGFTTHHPERFAKAWRDAPDLLMSSAEHITAFKNGQVHDWTVGRLKRITEMHEVTKKVSGKPKKAKLKLHKFNLTKAEKAVVENPTWLSIEWDLGGGESKKITTSTPELGLVKGSVESISRKLGVDAKVFAHGRNYGLEARVLCATFKAGMASGWRFADGLSMFKK